jgi:16S rRNA (uracil1498-N3)-methyltransferase
MHRFFITADVRSGNEITLSGAVAHQIARVLRLRAGEEVVLIPADAREPVEWWVRLEAVGASSVTGKVIAERPGGLPEPDCTVTLCAALLKGERFDWLLQKATEVGVSTIQPMITRNTVRKVGAEDRNARERWRRIVTEAAEQCGRIRIPEVRSPVALGEIALTGYDVVLCAYEAAVPETIARHVSRGTRSVALLIGPEGGFTADEAHRLAESGPACLVSLGPRTLRAETAGMTALTLTLAAAGDMEPRDAPHWRALDDSP